VLQKAVISQAEAAFGPVRSCGEGEVVHAGDGLDGVVEAVAALPAVTEDLVVLHAGEGVLDAGTDLAMLRVVLLLALQQGSPRAFAVRDEYSSHRGNVRARGHRARTGQAPLFLAPAECW
jgi:hypothetical protein